MKKIITILVSVLIISNIFAQTPQKMSYQAVVRNSSNQLVSSHQIGVKISILASSITGTAVYEETQNPTTNENGLFSIEIGAGTVISGNFATINWGNSSHFIKTEIDPEGGTNYTISAVNQLLSVPYALHAKTAETFTGTLTETDPKVGTITTNYTPKWNGSSLTTGTIYDNGNVGIGNNSPNEKLEVTGNIKTSGSVQFNGTLVANGNAGTSGQVLTSSGESSVPIWQNVTVSKSVKIVSSNVTLTNTDEVVIISGAFIATFPASPANGQVLMICGSNPGGGINTNGKTVRTVNNNNAGGTYTFSDLSSNLGIFVYESAANIWHAQL